jgi:hypothetical protein
MKTSDLPDIPPLEKITLPTSTTPGKDAMHTVN